jgi:hypothetical protein
VYGHSLLSTKPKAQVIGLPSQHQLLNISLLLAVVAAAKILVAAAGLEVFVQRLVLQLVLAHQSQ